MKFCKKWNDILNLKLKILIKYITSTTNGGIHRTLILLDIRLLRKPDTKYPHANGTDWPKFKWRGGTNVTARKFWMKKWCGGPKRKNVVHVANKKSGVR